jgi:hypothetical protein
MAPTSREGRRVAHRSQMPDGRSIIVAEGDEAPLEYGYRELEPNQGPGDALPHVGAAELPEPPAGATRGGARRRPSASPTRRRAPATPASRRSRATPAAETPKPADMTVAQLDERYGSVEGYPSKGNKAEKVKFAETSRPGRVRCPAGTT